MKACTCWGTKVINTEIASVNIKDDKTVIKIECDETVNQAPVINCPVFNTDSSQQSLARNTIFSFLTIYNESMHLLGN
jgi:hypothetical protein